MPYYFRRRVAGFSLVEVLIALVILSVGLLGIAAMVSESLKSKDSAYYRTQAMDYAAAILDRMRANHAQATAGAYDVDYGGTGSNGTIPSDGCTSVADGCTPSQIAGVDLAQWQAEISAALPAISNSAPAAGSITTTTVGQMTQVYILVRWNDKRANIAVGSAASSVAAAAVTSVGTVTITSGL
ncbi:MAG TPA: type IV pilus modification protein PilV [Gammaproteobacteria bacterium]|jgi:type IV pilus assembly protein PilV